MVRYKYYNDCFKIFLDHGPCSRHPEGMVQAQKTIFAMELARKEEGIPSVTKNTTIQDLMTGPHISETDQKVKEIVGFPKIYPKKRNRRHYDPFSKRHKGAVKGLMEKGDVQHVSEKRQKRLQSI